MRVFHWILIFVASLMLAACGGGDSVPYCGPGVSTCSSSGGGDGGSTTGSPTLILSISSTTVTVSTPATVTATAKDAKGAALAGQVVSFSTNGGLGVFSADTALTDAKGVATVQLSPASPSANGADLVVAKVAGAETDISGTIGFQVTVATAEGVYGGALAGSKLGSDFEALVLGNGDFWSLYGEQTTSGFLVSGFVQGHGSSDGVNFKSSDTKDFGLSPAVGGATAATYDAKAGTIKGSVAYSGQSVSFAGGPIPGSQYVYARAPALSEITGQWVVNDTLVGDPVALAIASDGSFSGTSVAGCRLSGSLAAHPSGKNLFNVSLTFGPAPCLLANQSATGIAITYPLPGGLRQLIVAGFDATRTHGTAIFGIRSALPPPAPSATAEGVYGGTLAGSTMGSDFEALVLDNGDLWAIYGEQTTSGFLVSGFVQGHGSSDGVNFTSLDTKDFGLSPAVRGATAATYDAKAGTIKGSVAYSGQSVSFAGGPIPGSQYVYARAPALSEITGQWVVNDTLVGDPVALTIASDGSFSGTSVAGCRLSGSLAAHPSGKNVFTASLKFGPAPCLLASQGATGIAITYPVQGGFQQLIVAGFDATRTHGTAIFGTR